MHHRAFSTNAEDIATMKIIRTFYYCSVSASRRSVGRYTERGQGSVTFNPFYWSPAARFSALNQPNNPLNTNLWFSNHFPSLQKRACTTSLFFFLWGKLSLFLTASALLKTRPHTIYYTTRQANSYTNITCSLYLEL